MLVNHVMTIFRVLTWCCVIAFAVLSLLPAQELADLSLLPALEMARTRLPPPLEHFFAYAGAAAIAMAGTVRAEAARGSSAGFGCAPASWSICGTFRPVGIRGSRISRRRRWELCAAGSPSPSSGVARLISRVEGSGQRFLHSPECAHPLTKIT